MGGMALTPKPHNLVTDIPWVCPDLYTLTKSQLKAADFSAGRKLCRVKQQGVQSLGLLHSPSLMPYERECSAQEW